MAEWEKRQKQRVERAMEKQADLVLARKARDEAYRRLQENKDFKTFWASMELMNDPERFMALDDSLAPEEVWRQFQLIKRQILEFRQMGKLLERANAQEDESHA